MIAGTLAVSNDLSGLTIAVLVLGIVVYFILRRVGDRWFDKRLQRRKAALSSHSTRLTVTVRAPRSAVYQALLNADDVQRWMVPDSMHSTVHSFDPVEGGTFRISLTYDEATRAGKTTAQTDTFHGRFARLVPDTEVVQVVEFESDDPAMQGEMTITYRLADVEGGTELESLHEGLPPGVAPADNELGTRMSLDKLARLVEDRT